MINDIIMSISKGVTWCTPDTFETKNSKVD